MLWNVLFEIIINPDTPPINGAHSSFSAFTPRPGCSGLSHAMCHLKPIHQKMSQNSKTDNPYETKNCQTDLQMIFFLQIFDYITIETAKYNQEYFLKNLNPCFSRRLFDPSLGAVILTVALLRSEQRMTQARDMRAQRQFTQTTPG